MESTLSSRCSRSNPPLSRQGAALAHLSDSRSVLVTLSSPPSFLFYLKLCDRSGRNCLLSPVLSDYNGSPDTRFSWERRGLMSWPDGECYLHPLRSLVVSLLSSLVSTLVFSLTGGVTVSSKFFDTQIPSISTKDFVLPRHARCVFCRLRCNRHSLLLSSYLSRIGRIENPSRSVCGHSSQDTSPIILHCPAPIILHCPLIAPLTLWRLSVSPRPLVQTPGSCPASGAP